MKKILEKYDHLFLNENGERLFCIGISVPFEEIMADDVDFGDCQVETIGVLYDDCQIRISKFDNNSNAILVNLPSKVQRFVYEAYISGQSEAKFLIKRSLEKSKSIKNKNEQEKQTCQ